jgi:DNA anti-recombination protein RmuC
LVKYQIFKQENGNEEILEIINVFDIIYDKVRKFMQAIIENGKYEGIELSE